MLGVDLVLKVHVLGLETVPQHLDFGECRPEALVSPQAGQLGARPRSKHAQDRERARRIRHRLVVQDHQVPDQRSRGVQDGDSQVALSAERDQVTVVREEPLDFLPVVFDLALEDSHAGCAGDAVLEILSEALALPERARADPVVPPLDTLRNEGITDVQRRGEVLDQRVEEVAAGHRGGAFNDRAERLFDLAAASGLRSNLAVERGDRLVRLHVLDGQADLVRRLLEKGRVGVGILARGRAGDGQDTDAPAPGDERHHHVRADAVLEGALFHRISTLATEVAAHKIALLLERPADVALFLGHLHADGEIGGRQR